jgi:16S rRNA (cytidine1402-2'-O)-methyltransferase
MAGRLVLCPTPIGNLADVTLRALDELRGADLILAEDTRRTRTLLQRHGIARPLRSLHDHNEARRCGEVMELLARGARVALVSDAGTPLVADPGFALVRAAMGAGFTVTALPGPSALLPALVLSGLPMHRFAFLGFPPHGAAARRAALREGLALGMTVAWYESPRRLGVTLAELERLGAGERPAAVVREISKLHEEVRRGSVASLARDFAEGARGEIVLVVGPQRARPEWDEAVAAARSAVASGLTPARAAAAAAARYGVLRGSLYATLVGRGGAGPLGRMPRGRPRRVRRPSTASPPCRNDRRSSP